MASVRIRDDRGKALTFAEPPRRVVSLVPSDTYSIVRLGAAERLVGRTRYCVEPAGEVEPIEVVGGTKDADVERIVALAPDVVVANQEENARGDIQRLEDAGVRVLLSFPRTVASGVNHLARLASLFGLRDGPAKALVAGAYHALREADAALAKDPRPPVRVFVPIWMDPLMTCSGDTFTSDVLALAGARNVFVGRERRYPLAADLGRTVPLPAERIVGRDVRYPRITPDEVVARAPELILLPDEPHPFSEADAAVFRALDVPAARLGNVRFCDGKDLTWYGARGLEGLARLRALVDAARAGRPDGV
jgi:ABC-type Fe3+-hydroxamate transport system substrate-binding protein